jgi:hypothetical protein
MLKTVGSSSLLVAVTSMAGCSDGGREWIEIDKTVDGLYIGEIITGTAGFREGYRKCGVKMRIKNTTEKYIKGQVNVQFYKKGFKGGWEPFNIPILKPGKKFGEGVTWTATWIECCGECDDAEIIGHNIKKSDGGAGA